MWRNYSKHRVSCLVGLILLAASATVFATCHNWYHYTETYLYSGVNGVLCAKWETYQQCMSHWTLLNDEGTQDCETGLDNERQLFPYYECTTHCGPTVLPQDASFTEVETGNTLLGQNSPPYCMCVPDTSGGT